MDGVTRINVRMLMANSLSELTKNISLAKITVQDIVDNCGLARQTFYNHFKDKRELINWIFKTNSDEVIRNYYVIILIQKHGIGFLEGYWIG